jgi:dihydroorotate dehydrogenase electron transfer subunit
MNRLLEKPAEIAPGHYLLRIEAGGLRESQPGQFVNIRACSGTDPLLRRPFSVHSHENGELKLIVKEVGKGTAIICGYSAGAGVDIIGPLGRGFTLLEKKMVLLAGGGVGNAPLYHLARALKSRGCRVVYLFAARSKDLVYGREQYTAAVDEYHIATDDGSEGFCGSACDLAKEVIVRERPDFIYTCGPLPMMSSLAVIAGESGIPVEVSLEKHFGCGTGLCSGCAVETTGGNRRVCVDGPVMDGASINWAGIG